MRRIILALAFALAAGSAMASSIEPVTGKTAQAGSIIALSCKDCPPMTMPEKSLTYIVPSLPAGETQTVEIRDEGGSQEIRRTERWMGGSPILFINRAQATMQAFLPSPPALDGIDRGVKTAAVGNQAAGEGEPSPSVNIYQFELRQ